MSIFATRVRGIRTDGDVYTCSRCGIERKWSMGRVRPVLCADCRWVLLVEAKEDESPTFARALAAGFGHGWTRLGLKQDEPPGEETPDGSERQAHSIHRMEDDA